MKGVMPFTLKFTLNKVAEELTQSQFSWLFCVNCSFGLGKIVILLMRGQVGGRSEAQK